MDLAFEMRNNLSDDLCHSIIERFEADQRKRPGQTGGGYRPEVKNSNDLMFSRFQDWSDIVTILDDKMKRNLNEYQEFLNSRIPIHFKVNDGVIWHCGYQLQKSGYYRWHHDSRIEFGRTRILTFIWYLNTIEKGGETGFVYKNVKPETGKFVLFPSTWDYVHCGFDAQNKYIITGWLFSDL